MEHEINKKAFDNELKKIFNEMETQLDKIGTLSTRQIARRLRAIGEQFIYLSKEVRRKNFGEETNKKK
jgi:hypothetical protein